LKGRTDEYRSKCEQWDRTNEQKTNELDTDIKNIKAQRDDIKSKLEEIKEKLKKEQSVEKERLDKEDSQKKAAIDKENKEKAKIDAIKWIQAKLLALHPFKPPKGRRGAMMAMIAMMK